MTFQRVTAGLDVVEDFPVEADALGDAPWVFQDKVAQGVFSQMESRGVRLHELVVRFGTGVQTGADKLLTLHQEDAQRLKLEPAVTTLILRGRDVRAFHLAPHPKLLLFPYRAAATGFELLTEAELQKHTNAYAYLKEREAQLADRVWFGKTATELSGAWYGLMYLEDRATIMQPHLLTPALSARSNFARGNASLFATGTAGVTAIVPKPALPESLEYLLAVLNSDAASVYICEHSPIYQGGYHKFSAPYLKAVPVPRLDLAKPKDRVRHDRIVSLVKQAEMAAAAMDQAIRGSDRERERRRLGAARHQINREVSELYALDAQQATWVASRAHS